MDRSYWSWGDVGAVGAVLSVLAFQALRYDSFESEKAGLLIVCCGLMLIDLLSDRAVLRRVWTHPILLAAGFLTLIGLASSMLALSPERALVGSGFRSYGWIVMVCQAILVLYVAAHGSRLRTIMPFFLFWIAVPLCFLAIFQAANSPDLLRPGSTTGNSNYLAAWLGMAALWITPTIGAALTQRSRWGGWIGLGLWGLLVLFTLNLTGSRAAFIGIILAGVAGVLLWGALRRNLIPMMLFAILMMLMGGLIALMQGGYRAQVGFARLIEPVDDFRQMVWANSLSMIENMPVPLIDHLQQPDRLAAARPLLGYGLDNLDTLRSRTDISVVSAETIVDRMHSLLYDTLLSTGWLGLIAQLLIFEMVWLSLLASAHGLTSWRDGVLCVGLQIVACIGIFLIGRAVGWTMGISLVFVALGLVIGLLLWLAWITYRARSTPAQPISLWLIGLWSASLFYFVCHLFGFQQVVSSVLFAALVGFSVSETVDEQAISPQIDMGYLTLAIVTIFGVSLLRSMAVLPFIAMIAVFAAGCAASLWLIGTKTNARQIALWSVGIFLLFVGMNELRIQLSLAINQTLLSAPSASPQMLILQTSGYAWLTWIGYGCAGFLIWRAGQPRALPVGFVRRSVMTGVLIAGVMVAIASQTGSTLWKTAHTLQSIANAQYAADFAYQSAEMMMPWNVELRIDHLRFLRTPIGTSLGQDSAALYETLLALEPFINNRFEPSTDIFLP